MTSIEARVDWEIDYVAANRGRSGRYPWEQAIGVAWQLLGWTLEQVSELPLTRQLVDENWDIDHQKCDPVLAALSVAVLEQAWRQDSVPREVTLTGVFTRLGELADRRHVTPFYDNQDDLRPLLLAASDVELADWTSVARRVLTAHLEDRVGPEPVTVADRLPHCPTHMAPHMLLRLEGRRQLDVLITPAPPPRRLWVGGQFTVSAGGQDAEPVILTCPECDATTELAFTSEAGAQNVTGHCPHGHTWPVPELSSRNLGQLIADSRTSGQVSPAD